MEFLEVFTEAWLNYARYLGREIVHPHLHNYVYWLVGISLAAYALELLHPWRHDQSRLRRDFWLDALYMFWNFFLFPMLVFIAVAAVAGHLFELLRLRWGMESWILFDISRWPTAVQLLVMFVLRDFIHWNVHRVLHRVPWMWELHKVHHSVREMGFAAHLRYHWTETLLYRLAESLPLAAVGFGVQDFLVVHLLSLSIGHLNHANFRMPMGPLRYVFNSAAMHIWHHARTMPPEHRYGMNFGISLSIWDYLFRSAYLPHDGRDIELGFDQLESFPGGFLRQLRWRPHRSTSEG